MNVIVIDNYDSFTFNLVQYIGALQADVQVFRNDKITIEALAGQLPDAFVISPGPGTPAADSGISNDVIRVFSGRVPIFGVCLGQQCMGHVFGGSVGRARTPMHGKVSQVRHDGAGLFAGLSNPFVATRYHSLVIHAPLPAELIATAHSTDDEECMGVRHISHPTYGVQFHPESILTTEGMQIVSNFLQLARTWNHVHRAG